MMILVLAAVTFTVHLRLHLGPQPGPMAITQSACPQKAHARLWASSMRWRMCAYGVSCTGVGGGRLGIWYPLALKRGRKWVMLDEEDAMDRVVE